MRTMEPREKGWFKTGTKVAYFLLGSGTVGGDLLDRRITKAALLT